MNRLALSCTLGACLVIWPAMLHAQEWITVGRDVLAFHEDIFREQRVKIEPPVVNDAEIFIELIGIPNAAKINELRLQIRRSVGLRNAGALSRDNYRSIIFDPAWAAGATPEFYLVLGHEVGHHFCGHTIGKVRSNPWDTELEADRFGGASIRRFEIYHNRKFFDAVLAAAATRYQEKSSDYPPRALRLKALREGYEQGSSCGNLAPVDQAGFARGPR